MSNRRATFELQVLVAKNWTVRNLYDDEETAKQAAEQDLKSGRVEGVRILRLWKRADGEHAEKQVFEKMGAVKPLRDVRITPVESAPMCREEAEFLGHDSLALMARLFRKYLDETCLTPTEVLHVWREYQRIWDTESIVMAGVDRVALVQTRGSEMLPKTRGEEIYRAIEGIGARARRADRRKNLPRRIGTRFGVVLRDEDAADPFDGTFAATVVLARDLAERRDWLGKLDRLGELLAAETDAEARAILDSVAAQVFMSRDVLIDALGPRHNLAAAIEALLPLLAGGAPGFDAAMPRRETFVAGLKAGALPLLRATLVERCLKMVAGPGELSRFDPTREDACFRTLANRLIGPSAVVEGEAAALALLERAGTFVVEGGVTGRKRALDWLLMALDGAARRIALLRCLDAPLTHEPEVRGAAFEALRRTVEGAALADLAPGQGDPLAPLAVAADLSRWLARRFPPKAAQPVCAHLDALSAEHLVTHRVIERIDHPELALADRATRLLGFLLSGTLTEGRATDLARSRIRDHLKRPDFVEAFAAGFADAAACERGLRELHAMMTRAGISANV
ncbi:conserved hypothetical protein [uncultured Alphaproteobacteria bacterium]|uniref:Uncharacterized protein n=1 Tax=uncultured Alphaproteobacteria bacterium TaxID=91750 RepID=A0A212JJL1_9PROT|nr:conserved hypothetical protein [uncultured Alphaproteobacteria bacterium]